MADESKKQAQPAQSGGGNQGVTLRRGSAEGTFENVGAQYDGDPRNDLDGGRPKDATDMGVPMLEGDRSEPQGPEDALGAGPKRGDYSGRVGDEFYQPHEIRPVEDAKPGEPQVAVHAQRPRASQQGDEKGKKGGVDTHAEAVKNETPVTQ